jgi:hypothetical protein
MTGKRGIQLCLAVVLHVTVCFALPPTIGIASAVGSFILNSNRVYGNANLFDGSELKTGRASSQVFLQNGAALTLGINSAGTVYRDHLLLEKGATKVDNMNGYSIRTADYRIEQQQPASQAVVRLDGDMLEVAALAGSLGVFNQKGSLLTHIGAGTASAFQTEEPDTRGGNAPNRPNNNNRLKYQTATALLLAATLAGLGLAIAAIVQPEPTSH